MEAQNLALSDIKDMKGVDKAKKKKNDGKAFHLVYNDRYKGMEVKPVVPKKPLPVVDCESITLDSFIRTVIEEKLTQVLPELIDADRLEDVIHKHLELGNVDGNWVH